MLELNPPVPSSKTASGEVTEPKRTQGGTVFDLVSLCKRRIRKTRAQREGHTERKMGR